MLLNADLYSAKTLLYDPAGFLFSGFIPATESMEYGAAEFKVDNLSVIFRIAKITPLKTGQFVTIWKRIHKKPIQPYDMADRFDFLVISVREAKHFGQFVFPKAALAEQGILSIHQKGGKRGIRVYPPWCKNLNKQAQKSQQWQIQYFLEITDDIQTNCLKAKLLYQTGISP